MKNKFTNIFLLFVATMMVVGCYTERKARRQAVKHQAKYPAQMASNCSLWYPVKENTVINTKYIQGEPEVSHDTLVFTDTVTKETTREIRTTTKVVDTFYKDREVRVEDQAKLMAKDGLIQSKDKHISEISSKLSSVKTQRNISGIANVVFLLIIAGWLLGKRFKIF